VLNSSSRGVEVAASKETKQVLLDWALEAEKAARNVVNSDVKEKWLKLARTYRD
jgi:hypothetical protein